MLRRVLFALSVVGLLAIQAFGQQAGQIVGVVTDGSGGVVPGATVKATEVGTGFVRSVITGADGQYVLLTLRPTVYDLAAEAAGFRSFRRSGVELLANQSLTVSITLEVGSVTETVTVAGAVVQVDTSTSTLSEVVDNARILEMPLNGRDVARLSTLVPGAVLISVSTESGKSIPGGLRLSTNGSRRYQVTWKLDGNTNSDIYYEENQTFPFPDAVQEFSIQTSNYSAAQGNNNGGVVNVLTRSGTNGFHGGAFEFVRNRKFNARNTFNVDRDFLKRNQFGAFGGGPMRLPGYDGRNKTFFFMGWQGTRIRNLGTTLATFGPTIDQRRGDFTSCGGSCDRVAALRDPLGGTFPNKQIPTSRFDPASVKVNTYIPAVGGDGLARISRPIKHQLDQGVIKVDHQLTDKDRMTGRYFIDHFQNAGTFDPSNLLSYRGPTLASRVRTQNAVLNWVRTFGPSLLNDFHFGFNRVHAARGPFFSGVPSMQDLGVRLPLYPTLPSISEINVAGFFNIGDNLEAKFPRTMFEWGNRTSWVRGRHSVQFGTEISRNRADIVNEFRRAGHFQFSGDVTGHAMADYFLGIIRTFDQGTGEYKFNRATYPSFFLQDDWKVARRLTLNLGIRYEASPPYHETRGRIQRFRLEDYAAGVKSTRFRNAPVGETFRGDPGVPEDGTLGDYNNVSGRFGFAWDVAGDGKTSLRGGIGMFYDQYQDGEFNNGAVNAPPWNIRLSITQPQGPFSDPYRGRNDFNLVRLDNIGQPDTPFPRPVLLNSYDDRQEAPLAYNWNLTLEREVFTEWLARLAYVASVSTYGRTDLQLNPAVYRPGDTRGVDARRLFAPDLGNITWYTQDRRSNYHSLQASLTKRFSRRFTLQTNYTFSKSLDTYANVMPWYLPGRDRFAYGPSDFDHKHRYVLSYVWELPELQTTNPVARTLLHGWQWSGNGQYQTGSPLTINSGRDNSQTGLGNDRAKLTGVSREKPAGTDERVSFNGAAFAVNDVGTFGELGKGAFYGPSLFSWDMGVFKQFPLRESMHLQFRAEFFNIFNQTNLNNPVTNVSGGGFGRIINTLPEAAGDPRILQFALKFVF